MPLRRDPQHTYRGEHRRIAIDGGRHSISDSGVVARLARVSLLYTLVRWLKVSLEATYVNDLGDWGSGTLVRLCVDPSMPATPGQFGPGLDTARAATTNLGLRTLSHASAADAVLTGFVALRVQLHPNVTAGELEAGVRRAGTALGLGDDLAARWNVAGYPAGEHGGGNDE